MNQDHDYGGTVANQLRTLEHLDIFTKPLPAPPEETAAAGRLPRRARGSRPPGPLVSARQLLALPSQVGRRQRRVPVARHARRLRDGHRRRPSGTGNLQHSARAAFSRRAIRIGRSCFIAWPRSAPAGCRASVRPSSTSAACGWFTTGSSSCRSPTRRKPRPWPARAPKPLRPCSNWPAKPLRPTQRAPRDRTPADIDQRRRPIGAVRGREVVAQTGSRRGDCQGDEQSRCRKSAICSSGFFPKQQRTRRLGAVIDPAEILALRRRCRSRPQDLLRGRRRALPQLSPDPRHGHRARPGPERNRQTEHVRRNCSKRCSNRPRRSTPST